MNYTIDYLMFMNDGINPLFTQMIGKGGLGYKPKGNMIGGMAKKDFKGNIISSYFKKTNKKMFRDILVNYPTSEIPNLLNSDIFLRKTPKKQINVLISEIFDIAKINNDNINNNTNTNDEKNKIKQNMKALLQGIINICNDNENIDLMSIEMGNILTNIYKKIQKGKEIKIITNIDIYNPEDQKKIILLNNSLKNNTSNSYFNKTQEIATKKFNQYKKLKKEKEKLSTKIFNYRNKIDKNIDINELKKDIEKNQKEIEDYETINPNVKMANTINLLRGMESEDIINEKNILLIDIDGDNSEYKNSKDPTAYSKQFIDALKSVSRYDDEDDKNKFIDDVLKYMPIDVIKTNTLWELKSFSLTKQKKIRNKYNKTKLTSSRFDTDGIIFNFYFKYNVENPEIYEEEKLVKKKGKIIKEIIKKKYDVTYLTYNPETHGKIINVDNISCEIEKDNDLPYIIDNILPINNIGYNYFFGESTPKGFRGINPLEKLSEHKEKGNDLLIDQTNVITIPFSHEIQNENENVKDYIYSRQQI